MIGDRKRAREGNTLSHLEVIQKGLLSTIQDQGRQGLLASGFCASGCMDTKAFHDANVLVNNPLDAAVIEMTFLGGAFRFHTSTFFALTGADMQAELNGKRIPNYKSLRALPGDQLVLKSAVSGRFTYLAVAGGIRTEMILGSRSTNLKCKIGGLEGRALQVGDNIPIPGEITTIWNEYLKEMIQVTYEKKVVLRVVKGPQDDYFTEKGLQDFFTQTYQVTQESDRMGYRLDGAPVEYKDKVDILSDGIVAGSIQIPPSGKPMIMLADRQTTGGYAKIGTVIAADLPILSQCMPGAEIQFEEISVEKAVLLYKKYIKDCKRFERQSGYIVKCEK